MICQFEFDVCILGPSHCNSPRIMSTLFLGAPYKPLLLPVTRTGPGQMYMVCQFDFRQQMLIYLLLSKSCGAM